MRIVVFVVSIFCLVATLIPLFKNEKWYFRVFEFPYAQLTALTLLMLLTNWIFFPLSTTEGLLLSGLLLLALIHQFTIVLPYTPIASNQVLTAQETTVEDSLSLLSSNIYMLNREAHRILEQIEQEQPDIVILLETDQWWCDQMQVLKEDYPYFVEEPLDNMYGLLFYSKLKLIDPQINYLIEEGIPSLHTKLALRNGKIIQVYGLHPAPPSPTEHESSKERDAELVLVARAVKKHNEPTVVMGDLNDVAWSRTTRLFQKISGLLDPRIGRGFYNTFNTKWPLLRWPLDHIFHSNHFKLIDMKRLPNVGSDHFPILAHLQYQPIATAKQETPSASRQEQKEAQRKIEQV